MDSGSCFSRRRFLQLCSALAATLAARTNAASTSTLKRTRNRVLLTDSWRQPIAVSGLQVGETYLFHYPYVSTPCYLIDLGEPTETGIELTTETGERYRWQGGVGPRRSPVAFSAICAHKMSHPLRSVSFINYRHEAHPFTDHSNSTRTQSQVIHCCSEHSVYDVRRGGEVLGGPAPQPLAAIVLDYDEASDALYATGSYGGELFEPYLDKFQDRLVLEYETTEIRRPVSNTTELRPITQYCRNQILCCALTRPTTPSNTSPNSWSITPILFVLTGAGVSTGSGIPDYRDNDGEWKRKQPVQYQDFIRSDTVRKRYWARSLVGWRWFAGANPNNTHRILAQLEGMGKINQLVTQNVDRLHQRAGSRQVIDLHGRIDRLICLQCGAESDRETFQLELVERNETFAQLTAEAAPDGDADLDGIDFTHFVVPNCPSCGGTLKPHVVFFGESVPKSCVEQAMNGLRESDALLVVGSSLMVFSGYRFARETAKRNLPIAAINLGRTRADELLELKVTAPCSETLERTLAAIS